MATIKCIICNKEFDVPTYRLATAKFCSYACRSKWRSLYWTGANNPAFLSEPRTLTCQHCGKEFSQRDNEPITNFRKRKFCSMECTKLGQHRLTGEEHPLFKVDSRRKNRRGKHGSWARAVLTRDRATCQKCGERELPLHAHHIQSFAEHPEKRWDLSNGITLCYRCHLAEHAALTEKGVNSGEVRPGRAEDNPEPSFGRKLIEGVTTRGRVYRRWEGACDYCGAFVSKTWSEAARNAYSYCSASCRSKHQQVRRKAARANDGNASTSALRESDEMV